MNTKKEKEDLEKLASKLYKQNSINLGALILIFLLSTVHFTTKAQVVKDSINIVEKDSITCLLYTSDAADE